MTIENLRTSIPEYVIKVSDVLLDNGFEAYLAGGAVRDLLLARHPKDFDLTTNALPEQISALFPRSVSTNARFGTIMVIMEDANGETHDVEVTTYRKEEDYVGGRWPSKVEFTASIEEDLSRRDFTINAIAVNLKLLFDSSATLDEVLVDPFAGKEDLSRKVVRAVGIAKDRFIEDGLRSFRACRLASELEFELDEQTAQAIKETLVVAQKISSERIRDEFLKLLKYSPKPSVGIELFHKLGLLQIFMPELLETIGLLQPEWHEDDVYQHSLKCVDLAEDSIKVAALLHDIGKARTQITDEGGHIHYYSHDTVGADMAETILTRMRFPKNQVKRVCRLIRWHMFYYPSSDWRKSKSVENSRSELLEGIDQGGWTDSAIRRFVKNVGEDLIDDLFKLRIADAAANPKSQFSPVEIAALEKRISEVRAKDMVIKLSDLDIDGNDLIEMGITPGPALGKVLNILLEKVIEEPLLNTKEDLLKIAAELRNHADIE